MEPTLPKGSSILVDRARQRPQKGHIYVVRTGDGVVVKRLKRKDGVWMMTSDNPEPEHSSTRLASETEVIGEVRWMARSIR